MTAASDTSSPPPGSHRRVAVVIPCHNYGRFLGEALDSVLAQTQPPTAVVVVDDGSEDDTPSVARRYAERGVAYIRQRRSGANAARNNGLRHVGAADFVVFLDADDRLHPDYIERCLDAVHIHGAAFAYTQVRHFGSSDWVSEYPVWSAERLLEENFVHISALLRVDLMRRFPYDERVRAGGMDWDLYLTLAQEGFFGVLVDAPLLEYRQHAESIRRKLWNRRYKRHLIAARLVWKHRQLYGPRAYGRVVRELQASAREFGIGQTRRARLLKRRVQEALTARMKWARAPDVIGPGDSGPDTESRSPR